MKKILYLSFFALLFSGQYAFAAPAYPHPITYPLPDGTEMTIQLQGDEWINWAVSEDGYTMLFNADGFLEYAIQDNSGDLMLSGVRAHNPNERSGEEQSFLRTLPKNLRYSATQKENMRKVRGFKDDYMRKSSKASKALTGTIHIPIILIEFQDKKFSTTKRDFEILFNQVTHTAPGSLHDYFYANSYGKLDLQVDVFGPYTLPGNVRDFDERCGGNPRRMARLAVDSAYYSGGADFSNYAISDGENVDAIHLIFAGYGGEAGGAQCNSIHSHAWTLPSPVQYNGKTISSYSCSPELRGNAGTEMTYIGVIAHELGHSLLKLPDFYDTDGKDVNALEAVHPQYWCLMASGNWVDNGRTPSNFSAYARDFAGWVPAITLSEPTDIFLPHPMDSGVIYRVNTKTEDEYFLIENRQRVGWDAQIPYNSGMVIYHVNKNIFGWNNNEINTDVANRGYYLEQAGCSAANGCSEGREYDAWGPLEEKTEFTDNSVPNAKSASGQNTEKPITEIVFHREERTISFKFMGGTPPPYYDAELVELQCPELVIGAQTQIIKATLANWGKEITSATIHWRVNGVEQTPLNWTGSLIFEKSTLVTLGAFDVEEGVAYKITATVVVLNDSVPENNTATKILKVYDPFFTEGFEGDASNWIFKNGTQANQWHIGEATARNGKKSVYISNNNGATNQYTTANAISAVHFYRDVEFPVATDSFDLFFDFKGTGQTNFTGTTALDYMEVRVVETSVTPEDSVILTAGTSLGTYVNQNTWRNIHQTLSPVYAGTTQRLVFSWYNDRTVGTQAPAAIDNIRIDLRPDVEPFNALVLSQSGLHTFVDNTFGYEQQAPFAVAVSNAGTVPTGELTIALSGTNMNSFELSKTSIADIAVDTQNVFTLAPKQNLETGTYTATVTVEGENEISESFDVRFTVNQANGAEVETPMLDTKTDNSIVIFAVSPPSSGQTVEYAIHTENTIPENWQEGLSFSSLEKDVTYYIFARSKTNKNYHAGEPSTPLEVTTGTSSISEFEKEHFLKLFPNPVVDELRITNYELRMGNVVEIFDMNGKRVYMAPVGAYAIRPMSNGMSNGGNGRMQYAPTMGEQTINVSHLPTGTYILKIGKHSTKIVKVTL